MTAGPCIAPGRAVALHLAVRFGDGFLALSTFEEEPIRCTIGDGTLTPGLEGLIGGLVAGDDLHFLADGSELFGPWEEDKVQWLAVADFPPDLDPQPGRVIAFETPGGHETSGAVLEVDGPRVKLDFNHPFAGRSLTLRVKVLAVD